MTPVLTASLRVRAVTSGIAALLEGECEWHVGEKLVRATPGTYLFIPPGVAHDITNVSERPARVLMTVSPPGHEHYFEELAKLAANVPPTPTRFPVCGTVATPISFRR